MADFSIKQNDTGPPLEAVLSDAEGPIDLSTATSVKLLLRGQKRIGAVTVSGVCTIVTPLLGEVKYTWVPADTIVADLYLAEFEIQWADGTIWTIPNDKYFYVDMLDDLG